MYFLYDQDENLLLFLRLPIFLNVVHLTNSFPHSTRIEILNNDLVCISNGQYIRNKRICKKKIPKSVFIIKHIYNRVF